MTRYDGQHVLQIGLGVSGVSALAYLSARGAVVDVTDSRAEPPGLASAQAQLPAEQIVVGGLRAPRALNDYRLAVVSPGLPSDLPLLAELRAAGVPLVGDIELFAREAAAPVLAVTGSNGKSTVVTLLGRMAEAAGVRAAIGGNLGPAALELLDDAVELYVLELSSFQLEQTDSLAARAAVVLNLSEDHLDRHGNMDAYARAKARIYNQCEYAIYNRDDARVVSMCNGSHSFGLGQPDHDEYGLRQRDGREWIARGEQCLVALDELKIAGRHNAANAMAALAMAEAAGLAQAACLQALREFEGLPHRCQWVAERGGVIYLDDSKGTNVGAAVAALEGMPGPVVWLGGGQGKGQDFSPLRPVLAGKARAALLFGEDAGLMAAVLEGSVAIERTETLQQAVSRAAQLAQPGDRVLLSPACASLDQFRSYIERGRCFADAVGELAQ